MSRKMTKSRILWLAPLLIAINQLSAQQTCHRADVNSAHFIETLVAMMDTAAGRTSLRTTLNLPVVAASQITLVTDSAVCARAGQAADSVAKVWDPSMTLDATTDPLYVIKVGTSYAVADLNNVDDGHGDFVFIFGPLWEYRGIVLM
jgi:hypothetical protein